MTLGQIGVVIVGFSIVYAIAFYRGFKAGLSMRGDE